MINYESILSSYDDKLTLMQWLKKVEAALAASVLTAIDVTQNGDVVTLSFDFEDGTKIETPAIRVNQQITGAQVVNGELVFYLSNGQSINAGNLLDGNPLIIPAVNVNFNGNANIEGFLTAEAGVSTPSLTCDGEQINAQKPVVELMNGYSFTVSAKPNLTVDCKYAGICKNGNKITLIVFAELTRTDSVGDDWSRFGYFIIPASIGEKLVTHSITGMSNTIYDEMLDCIPSQNTGVISIYGHVTKASDTALYLAGFNVNSLTLNTKYAMRFEATFLLSENLAA